MRFGRAGQRRASQRRELSHGGRHSGATHPVKGGPDGLREIIVDGAEFYFRPIPPATSPIKVGQLTALAVSGSTRASPFPDIRTTVDARVKLGGLMPITSARFQEHVVKDGDLDATLVKPPV